MSVIAQSEQPGSPEPDGAFTKSILVARAAESVGHGSVERNRPVRPAHLVKSIGMALGLTALFMLPQLLIHIPTGIFAPISAGITTGGVMKVRPLESFIIGVTLFLVITLPAPTAYLWLGFANHLPFVAVAAFSFSFGAYYGTLIGLFSALGARISSSKIGA